MAHGCIIFNDVWFIEPEDYLNVEEIYDLLIPFIDSDKDYLFVIEINLNNQRGWMPDKAWEWIKERSS